jgi:large subunit ribosomal protein L24
MIYLATYQTRSKQLGSALSKDLHKKYGKRSIRVVEGDSVKIVRGEYKGVDGKISKVSTQKSTVAIEGIKKEKTKGDKFDVYIHTSNLLVTSLNSEDKWRMAKIEGKDPKKQPKKTQVKEESGKEVPKETKEVPKETKEVPKETKEVEKPKKKEDDN